MTALIGTEPARSCLTRAATRRMAVVGVLLMIGGLSAGCGGSDTPPVPAGGTASTTQTGGAVPRSGIQVSQEAGDALTHAGAVHLTGSLGNVATRKPVTVDIWMQKDGTRSTRRANGVTLQLIRTGGVTYVRGSADYYEKTGVPRANAEKLDDRWVRAPANSDYAFVDRFDDLVASFTHPGGGASIEPRVQTATIDGRPVLVVSQTDTSQLFVAASGVPYPVRLISAPRSGRADTRLSDFGKQQTIAAPTDVIDGTELLKTVPRPVVPTS